jgi:hypothetical protein
MMGGQSRCNIAVVERYRKVPIQLHAHLSIYDKADSFQLLSRVACGVLTTIAGQKNHPISFSFFKVWVPEEARSHPEPVWTPHLATVLREYTTNSEVLTF